jgi:DNA-binding beta-propeller fold protein YncE
MSDADAGVDPLPDTGVGRLAGFDRAGNQDGSRAVALFSDPVNVVVLPNSNILVADFNNNKLRQVTPEGDVSSLPTSTGFFRPFGMVVMADGSFLVETDEDVSGNDGPNNGAMWRVTVNDSAVLIVNDPGRLRGLVALPDGRVFATDYLNHYVGIFTPTTGAFAPLAGLRGTAGNTTGTGNLARFNQPYGAVRLPNGDMLVADNLNHCLREITLAGVVTTYAGVCGTPGLQNGPVATARFRLPQALAIDNRGRIFVTETGGETGNEPANYDIRLIQNGQVTTLAGNGMAGYAIGAPLQASFFGLEGIAVTPDGSMLYIADGDRGLDQPSNYVERLPLGYLDKP